MQEETPLSAIMAYPPLPPGAPAPSFTPESEQIPKVTQERLLQDIQRTDAWETVSIRTEGTIRGEVIAPVIVAELRKFIEPLEAVSNIAARHLPLTFKIGSDVALMKIFAAFAKSYAIAKRLLDNAEQVRRALGRLRPSHAGPFADSSEEARLLLLWFPPRDQEGGTPSVGVYSIFSDAAKIVNMAMSINFLCNHVEYWMDSLEQCTLALLIKHCPSSLFEGLEDPRMEEWEETEERKTSETLCAYITRCKAFERKYDPDGAFDEARIGRPRAQKLIFVQYCIDKLRVLCARHSLQRSLRSIREEASAVSDPAALFIPEPCFNSEDAEVFIENVGAVLAGEEVSLPQKRVMENEMLCQTLIVPGVDVTAGVFSTLKAFLEEMYVWLQRKQQYVRSLGPERRACTQEVSLLDFDLSFDEVKAALGKAQSPEEQKTRLKEAEASLKEERALRRERTSPPSPPLSPSPSSPPLSSSLLLWRSEGSPPSLSQSGHGAAVSAEPEEAQRQDAKDDGTESRKFGP